jgi:cell division transport system permease protein
MAYGARRAVDGLLGRKLLSAIAIGAIAASLLVVGLVTMTARNVEAMTARWGGGVQMVVYLQDGAGAERAARIAEALTQLPAVERVEYVPPERALDRLRATLGGDDALVEGLEVGMLPASLEVTLGHGIVDIAAAHPVVERLEATAGVDHVEFVGPWVDRLGALLQGLRYAGWIALSIAAGVCLYVVAATLRLGVVARRREAQVAALCGASPSFIRGPLLLEGILQGAIGAAVAAVALWLLYATGGGAAEAVLARAFGEATVAFLAPADLARLILVGAALGLAGSFLATGHRALA